jgi:hypothetical protein
VSGSAPTSEVGATLELMAEAVETFLRLEEPPIRDESGRMIFPVCSSRVIEVCKAVRIVSGLDAVWTLLAANHATEASALLRLVVDYAHEIQFVFASQAEAELSPEFRRFMAEFFRAMPEDVDEWRADRARRKAAGKAGRRVERRDVTASALGLLSEIPAVNMDEMHATRGALDHVLNAYVHGAYATAMELYNPVQWGFDLFGTPNARAVWVCTQFALQNLVVPLVAFELMALERHQPTLARRLEARREALIGSDAYNRPLEEPSSS